MKEMEEYLDLRALQARQVLLLLLLPPPPQPLFPLVLSLQHRPARRCCRTRALPTTSCAQQHPSQRRWPASWLGGPLETRLTLAHL